MYQKNIADGYIVSVVKGVSNGNISEEEYNTLIEIIENKPQAEEGFDYRLRENLTWELYQIPQTEDEESE